MKVIDANGNIKTTGGGGIPSGPAGGDLSGTYPNPSVVWGNGLSTYNSQYYPLSSNPSGYITSAALSPYLTIVTAASTYYPLTNPSGYITSAALSPYLTSALAASTYYPIPTGTISQYLRGDGSLATFPTIPTVTPAALTKTNDTNVTLTLGGSPSNALLQAVSLTVGWTGTLADSRIASAATWNAKQDPITLTTTGTSGAATLVGSTLNIPQYSGGGGGGIHALTKPVSGRRISYGLTTATTTGSNFTTSRLQLVPFIPANTFTISDILMYANSAVAGSLCRLLIYSDSNGVPNAKLYESADLDLSTIGFKIATTTFTFNAGTTYWLAFHGNATTSTVIHYQVGSLYQFAQTGASVQPANSYFVSANLGSAPANITSPSFGTGSVPWIAVTPA